MLCIRIPLNSGAVTLLWSYRPHLPIKATIYGQLPEVIMSSGMLTDFIRKPDMTKYVDSVDRRCFTFAGGNENGILSTRWMAPLHVTTMDGRLSSESECQYEVTASYKKAWMWIRRKTAISYEKLPWGGSSSDAIPYRTHSAPRRKQAGRLCRVMK